MRKLKLRLRFRSKISTRYKYALVTNFHRMNSLPVYRFDTIKKGHKSIRRYFISNCVHFRLITSRHECSRSISFKEGALKHHSCKLSTNFRVVRIRSSDLQNYSYFKLRSSCNIGTYIPTDMNLQNFNFWNCFKCYTKDACVQFSTNNWVWQFVEIYHWFGVRASFVEHYSRMPIKHFVTKHVCYSSRFVMNIQRGSLFDACIVLRKIFFALNYNCPYVLRTLYCTVDCAYHHHQNWTWSDRLVFFLVVLCVRPLY